MLADQITMFRELVTLKEGVHVLLRAMTKEDHSHLDEIYSPISEDDMRYLRHNVKSSAVLQEWCDHLNYDETLPLLALVKDHAVGSASLHFFKGPKRHMGEIRLFLSKEYRKRGLGMKMVKALIDIARKQGLLILTAEVTAEQTKFIHALEKTGFVVRCTLEDHFMFPDGDCTDVVLLTMNLKSLVDEF